MNDRPEGSTPKVVGIHGYNCRTFWRRAALTIPGIGLSLEYGLHLRLVKKTHKPGFGLSDPSSITHRASVFLQVLSQLVNIYFRVRRLSLASWWCFHFLVSQPQRLVKNLAGATSKVSDLSSNGASPPEVRFCWHNDERTTILVVTLYFRA